MLPRTLPLVALPLVLPFLFGCTPSRQASDEDPGQMMKPGDPGPMDKPGYLTISPNPIQVVLTSMDQTIRVTVRSSTYGDVTRKASWALSDPHLGFVSQGVLTLRGGSASGSKATLTATYGIQKGSATLNIKIIGADIVDPTAPANAADYFSSGDGGSKPSWVYPFDGTMLPRNQGQMNLQWSGPGNAQVYRVHIDSDTMTQDIYVGAGACPGGQCRFQPPDDRWAAVARSIAGTQATVILTASTGQGQPTGSADPLTLSFSPEDVKGGLYYWSTTITGIYRVPLGAKSAQVFINRGNEFGCAGCHAVSRDGKKVALEFGSADGVGGGVVDGANGTKYIIKPPNSGQWNLQTFSPKGDMLLVNWMGHAKVLNADTGALLFDVPDNIVGGRLAQPEWSPDGESIVFVRFPAEGSGAEWIASNTGDIMIMPWNGGMFGPPQMIVPSQSNKEYHFYPSWTPDSRWIIFNTGKVPCGGFGGAGGCNTYDASNTVLRIVRAEPGHTPIDLQRAMHQGNSSTNWPRCAPFMQDGGKLIFFTFSAKYPYGYVKQGGNPQVWMAGVDLDKAENQPDQDPSYAPFWLPFQNANENNHLGTWTTDVACNSKSDCPSEFDCVGGMCVPQIG